MSDAYIECKHCGCKSYNANDIREAYCARCVTFHASPDDYELGPVGAILTGPSGPTSGRPVVSSVIVTTVGGHDHVSVWNRGGAGRRAGGVHR